MPRGRLDRSKVVGAWRRVRTQAPLRQSKNCFTTLARIIEATGAKITTPSAIKATTTAGADDNNKEKQATGRKKGKANATEANSNKDTPDDIFEVDNKDQDQFESFGCNGVLDYDSAATIEDYSEHESKCDSSESESVPESERDDYTRSGLDTLSTAMSNATMGNETFSISDDSVDNWLALGMRMMERECAARVVEFSVSANLSNRHKKQLYSIINNALPRGIVLRRPPPFHPVIRESDRDHYVVFNVRKQLVKLKEELGKISGPKVVLTLDGGQQNETSPSSWWPVVLYFQQDVLSDYEVASRRHNVIIVGLAKLKKDASKPSDEFVKSCCSEVVSAGLQVVDVVCDLPARAFALNYAAHNSKHGCFYCHQKGRSYKRRMVFENQLPAPAKTAANYSEPWQNGAKGPSPFRGFVEMPERFPVEIMHCIGQGIGKRLLKELLDSGRRSRHYIGLRGRLAVQRLLRIMKLTRQLPLTKSDMELSHKWKAKFVLLFFMYFVPVLRPYVTEEQYISLLLLSYLVHGLCKESPLTDANIANLQITVELFARDFASIWGLELATMNFHSLRHLVEQSAERRVSPLTFSAFPNENFMSTVMHGIRGTVGGLEQAAQSLYEFIYYSKPQPRRKRPLFTTANADTKNLCNSIAYCKRQDVYFEVDQISNGKLVGQELYITQPVMTFGNCQSHISQISGQEQRRITADMKDCLAAIRIDKDHLVPVARNVMN